MTEYEQRPGRKERRSELHLHNPEKIQAVEVTTDKPSYRTTERIAVSLSNGSDRTLRTFDQRSYCTIVTLERKQNDSWEVVAPCALMRMAAPVDIVPGETKRVLLPPAEQPEPRLEASTHRVAFEYQLVGQDGVAQSPPRTKRSEVFTIS